jgi:transcriptional regulator with XRE-family HTH domain
MATMTAPNLSLVPRRRLGALLSQRREMHGYTLDDMARRSIGQFTVAELAQIEAGEAMLDDHALEALGLLYEFNSTPPIPQRSKLIIATVEDLPLSAGLDPLDPQLQRHVLSRYIGLLYLLRGLSVGDDLPLRGDDLGVLAEAFSVSPGEVQSWLGVVVSDVAAVAEHVERLRRRMTVPAAGLLVGPTPAGMLVLIK